jgi:predicted amidohydrolase
MHSCHIIPTHLFFPVSYLLSFPASLFTTLPPEAKKPGISAAYCKKAVGEVKYMFSGIFLEMDKIKIHSSVIARLIPVLTEPLQLFAELYKLLEPQFGAISNAIYTDPDARERFDRLSDFFLNSFKKISGTQSNVQFLNKIKQELRKENDNNILCLSLFKGAAKYLEIYKKGDLIKLDPFEINGYIITPKPPNPIYEALPGELAVREHFGTGLHDFTNIFKYISVIKKKNLKINLIKNDRLDLTYRYMISKARKGFRIAVTPFMTDLVVDIDSMKDKWPPTEKTPYWFKKIKNIEEAKQYLVEKILIPCLDNDVDVLVLPELSIDESLLIFLKDWLRLNNRERVSSGSPGLLLIAAGSFHFEDRRETNKRFNVATVLNHAGDILWTQNKIKRFSFDQSDIQKQPELQTLLDTSSAGGYECIEETDTIICADTPIGRISICICIDFFHPDHLEAYWHTNANVFLVAAMSSQNTRFLQNAVIFARDNLASIFVSNSGYAAKKENSGINKEGASFYFLPRKRETGTFPTDENPDLLIFDTMELTKS